MILDKLAYLREKFSLRKKKKPNRFKKKNVFSRDAAERPIDVLSKAVVKISI